jgi:iron complex outermembrane receptor protein
MYQKVETDGWNRQDAYNILGNPYTTTRPAVTLGEHEQYTQFEEPFTDEFLMLDLNIEYEFANEILLTSITSYTDRSILVVRDATALTASITGGSIGLDEEVYTLDAPLDDGTDVKGWTQELRLSGENGAFCMRPLRRHRRAFAPYRPGSRATDAPRTGLDGQLQLRPGFAGGHRRRERAL